MRSEERRLLWGMTRAAAPLIAVNVVGYAFVIPNWFPKVQTYIVIGATCLLAASMGAWLGFHCEIDAQTKTKVTLAIAAGLMELAVVVLVSGFLLLNLRGS